MVSVVWWAQRPHWSGEKGKWVRMWGLQVLVIFEESFAVKEGELWLGL